MNPTNEQELRTQIRNTLYNHEIGFSLANANGRTPEQMVEELIDALLYPVTAHTNAEIAKALIKELENIDKLTRPTLPNSGSVEMNVRAWCMDRIAILTKLKEVK